MTKHIIFLFFFSICFFSKAQNLVPNNGFDVYTTCVNGSSQVTLTPPWSNVTGATGSPDYMNACFVNGQQGVPNNFYGYQQPITTGGYYGLITYYSGQEVREYLTVPLSSSLVAGTVYSVGFHVSLSNNFKFATDHFGAHLSVGAITGPGNFQALPFTPQIDNPAGNIISDTTNWTLISGTYTALGGETHLTIGNFHSNANTLAINAYPTNTLNWAYYYVDEVFVIPSSLQILGNDICLGDSVTMQAVGDTQIVWVDSLAPNTILSIGTTLTVSPAVTTTYSVFGTTDTASYTVNVTATPVINLGNDTTFCQGGAITLDATSANATYLWQDNSTNAAFNVTQTGTYFVTATSNNCSATDTINVTVTPLPIMTLGPDIALCQGDSVTLNATTANATYLWQDNSTNATFTVLQAGTYWATVTVNNCSVTDSINVTYNLPPVVNLGNDTTLCQGVILPLNATTGNASYLWQNNSTNATFNVNQQGAYWVTVTVNNCFASDTINVTYTPLPAVNLGNDTTLCQGNSLTLDATAPSASYLWQDNSTAANFTLNGPGTYWVTVTAINCSATDSIIVNYNPLPIVNLGNDTTLCEGEILTLNVTSTGASYLWQNNSTNATFNVTQQGAYWVTVTNNNCTSTDSINVNFNPLPIVNLGNDTTLCLGTTLTLDATDANSTYLWQDNSTNAAFTAAIQSIYWVQVTAATGCSSIDSITINYTPALFLDLGPDLILCAGQTATLNATAPNASYLWQDGGTTPQNTISQSGQYSVDVSNQCETVSDTVNVVYFLPPPNYLGNDTSVCDWAGILLSVNLPGTQTQWQDQSISNTFMVTAPGTYTATTTLQGCVVTDQITIDFLYIPELDLGPDIVVCEIQSLVLADIHGAQGSYLWNVGSTENHIVADTAGLYTVELTNVCGTTMDTIELIEEGCNCLVYIPNSFTPDLDEHNRLFGVEYDCTFSEFQLRIFDRWGEMIWESRDPKAQWDGTYQNRMAPDGVYIYQLKYSSVGIFDEVVNGHVSLLR